MKIKRTISAVLCALLMTGGALADAWPEKTGIDPEGRRYVPTGDGRYEVWELIGVYGSPEEAMTSLQRQDKPEETQEKSGVSEGEKKSRKKGKVKIAKKPYKYELKPRGKVSEAVREDQTSQNRKVRKTKKAKAKKLNVWKSPKELEDLMKTGPGTQIFLQESKESGR